MLLRELLGSRCHGETITDIKTKTYTKIKTKTDTNTKKTTTKTTVHRSNPLMGLLDSRRQCVRIRIEIGDDGRRERERHRRLPNCIECF